MIDKKQATSCLQNGWERIFASDDPFTIPFTNIISSYLIFYPTAGYHLDSAQYYAVTQAAKVLGDEEFWISETEWQAIGFAEASHWHCTFPSFCEYEQLPLTLENALYSSRTLWGVLLSHEDHAIVGGSLQFIEHVKSLYPEWRADIEKLRIAWVKHGQTNWLDAILPRLMA